MSTISAPALTVVIPSYRRVSELGELIGDLASAQKKVDFAVLIVNDNGPDEAYFALKGLALSHLSNVNVVRNSENLGIDANIDKCLRSASTRYVFAIGDDDRINVEGFVDFVRDVDRTDCDMYLVEYSYVYQNLSMQRTRVLGLQDLSVPSGADEARRLLFQRGTKLGFLASVAFRTEAYIEQSDQAFLGTWYNHVGAALTILFKETSTIRFWEEPVVLNRAGDIRVTSWSSQVFDVIEGWWRMIALAAEKTGKFTMAEYRKNKEEVTFQYDSVLWMLSRRSENIVSWESLPTLFKTFDITTRVRLLYYGVCMVPAPLCRGMKSMARALGR